MPGAAVASRAGSGVLRCYGVAIQGRRHTRKRYILSGHGLDRLPDPQGVQAASETARSIQYLADLAVCDLEAQGIQPRGWNTLKIDVDEYRLRLNYRFRTRYRVTDRQVLEVEVFYVGHRREAYR